MSFPLNSRWTAGLQSVQGLLGAENLTVHQQGEHQGQDLTREEVKARFMRDGCMDGKQTHHDVK